MLTKLLLSFITVLSLHPFNQTLFTGSTVNVTSHEKPFFHFITRKETGNLKEAKRYYLQESSSTFLAHPYPDKLQKIDISIMLQKFLNLSDYLHFHLLQAENFFNFFGLNKNLILQKIDDNNNFFLFFLTLENVSLFAFSPSFFSTEYRKTDGIHQTFHAEIFSLEENSIHSENGFSNRATVSGSQISQIESAFLFSSPQKRSCDLVSLLMPSDLVAHEKKENTFLTITSVAPEPVVFSTSTDSLASTLESLLSENTCISPGPIAPPHLLPPLVELPPAGRDSIKMLVPDITTGNLSSGYSEPTTQHRSIPTITSDGSSPFDKWVKYKGHTQATYEAALREAGLTPFSSPLKPLPPSDYGYDPASYRQWGSSKNTQSTASNSYLTFLEELNKSRLKEGNSQRPSHVTDIEGLEAFSLPPPPPPPLVLRRTHKRRLMLAFQQPKNTLEESN